MKRISVNIFFIGMCIAVLSACSSKGGKLKTPDDSLFLEHPNDKKDTIDNTFVFNKLKVKDDSVYKIPYATASLLNWREYFRKNNKYKDWNSKNHQRVTIGAIIEKDGSTTDVNILKKCDENALNKEAVRLIRDAKANGAQIEPAKNEDGNPVRSAWVIFVNFPPE